MSKTILLIDEDEQALSYYTQQIKKILKTVTIFYARSAAEGLEIVKRSKPEVVLVQKNLPVIPALLFLSAVKYYRRYHKIRIFIYAEEINDEYSQLAKMLGASGCVEKKDDASMAVQELKAILYGELLSTYVFFQKKMPTHLLPPEGGMLPGDLKSWNSKNN